MQQQYLARGGEEDTRSGVAHINDRRAVILDDRNQFAEIVGIEERDSFRELWSDEDYMVLEQLFVEMEDELERFIVLMREADLLYELEMVGFIFPHNLELFDEVMAFDYGSDWNIVVVFNNEFFAHQGSEHVAELILERNELVDIFAEIEEKGMIFEIYFTRDAWHEAHDAFDAVIMFFLKSKLIESINYGQGNATILYRQSVDGSDIYRLGERMIRDSWYVRLPPPTLGDR